MDILEQPRVTIPTDREIRTLPVNTDRGRIGRDFANLRGVPFPKKCRICLAAL